MIFDSSDSRLALLNQVYAQLLASHMTRAMSPPNRMPPNYRMPGTMNPFGLPNPSGAPRTTATFTMNDTSHLTNVGLNGGAYNSGGPVGPPTPQPMSAVGAGPGGPHYSPPAMRPPAGIGPLPR